MLHGGFGSAEQAERSYGWDKLADSERFVVAYPDGVNRAWIDGGDHHWPGFATAKLWQFSAAHSR